MRAGDVEVGQTVELGGGLKPLRVDKRVAKDGSPTVTLTQQLESRERGGEFNVETMLEVHE